MQSSRSPWANDDLQGTIRRHNGIGADQDLSPDLRFRRNVAKLLKRRHSVENARQDALAVFILSARPPDGVTQPRVPMLDNGRTEVVGRIWFVSEVVRTGHFIENDFEDDAQLFDSICLQLDLGRHPTIVFDPRLPTPNVRFYPNGLHMEDDCSDHPITDTEVTPTTIRQVVDSVHESSFVTPAAGVPTAISVWENSEKCWPSRNAEAIIQSHLKAGLAAKYFDCDIRHEQPSKVGRLDLEIERSDPNDYTSITRLAVIELKVLRSFRYNGTKSRHEAIARHVTKGVRQVVAYKREWRPQMAFLFCFDMRDIDSGDECFSHIKSHAQNESVILSRWFFYNSAEAYRKATGIID